VAIGFGKSAPGESYPAIFVSGQNDGTNWISISVDKGRTWNRINDDAHQYGFTSNEITGDPRVFGRVYVATNGRGIVIGNIYRKRIGP
jgi:xyloglucan-specific exo-beta-1,4-glucanase